MPASVHLATHRTATLKKSSQSEGFEDVLKLRSKPMREEIDLATLSAVIERALSLCVCEIQLPGIAGADLRNVEISSERLQRIAARLEKDSCTEIRLSAELELFLRISNTDVLSSVELTRFLVQVNLDQNSLCASATNEKDWAAAWERGIEPLKQSALEGMRLDLLKTDEDLPENSYTFQAGMVLLASEFVGPYVDRIVTFLEYPRNVVQVIAARLQEAKVWEKDQVRCDHWFRPKKGGTNFMLDWMVAGGELTRSWSEEKKQYEYRSTDAKILSQFGV